MRRLIAVAVAVGLGVVLGACKSRREPRHDDLMPEPAPGTPTDAGAADAAIDAARWPAIAGLPLVDPVRVIGLPARPDVPRFDVGGPVIVDDVAVIASSQLGFAAVDWRRGTLVWTRPAGLHV